MREGPEVYPAARATGGHKGGKAIARKILISQREMSGNRKPSFARRGLELTDTAGHENIGPRGNLHSVDGAPILIQIHLPPSQHLSGGRKSTQSTGILEDCLSVRYHREGVAAHQAIAGGHLECPGLVIRAGNPRQRRKRSQHRLEARVNRICIDGRYSAGRLGKNAAPSKIL